MSKWKCGICNSEFDNFQAQGFGETIYCPLCYFKELYRRTKIEIDRLNKEYERIYNENCKLRENHNINDITLLDENERLNNIINELEKELREGSFDVYFCSTNTQKTFKSNEIIIKSLILDKLKELKEK